VAPLPPPVLPLLWPAARLLPPDAEEPPEELLEPVVPDWPVPPPLFVVVPF